MRKQEYVVRNAEPSEFEEIGRLMVLVYSHVDGFPKESEQPEYYKLLANAGEFTKNPETELLVAVTSGGKLAGCVVYISDMKYYGSGGRLTRDKMHPGSGCW